MGFFPRLRRRPRDRAVRLEDVPTGEWRIHASAHGPWRIWYHDPDTHELVAIADFAHYEGAWEALSEVRRRHLATWQGRQGGRANEGLRVEDRDSPLDYPHKRFGRVVRRLALIDPSAGVPHVGDALSTA